MPVLLRTLLESRRALLIIIALGLMLVLPSLASGWFADDFGHLLLLSFPDLLAQPDKPSLFHLFSFIDDNLLKRQQQYAFSLIPWWTGEQFKVNFFRPLSELSHYLDHLLFPRTAWLMHLHSLLWYALLLLLLAFFYRRLFAEQAIAWLALLLFAVDSTHGFTVAWIANRNAVIAAVFLVAAVLLFIRARDNRSDLWLWASAACVAASLLAAELGMTVMVFLLAWLIFMDKQAGWQKYFSLLPSALVFVAWLAFYRYFDFGASGNAAYYIDPLSQPGLFLQELPMKFFTAVAMQFNLLPIHLTDRFHFTVAVIGALIYLAWLVWAVYLKNRLLNFLLLAFSLTLIPVCTSLVQERNLLMAGIAAAAMLAFLLDHLWQMYRQQLWQRSTNLLAILLVTFHIGFSAVFMLPVSYAPAVLGKNSIVTAHAMLDIWQHEAVISLGVPFFDAAYFAAIRKTHDLPLPERFWNLVTRLDGLSVRRDENSLTLANAKGLFHSEDFLLRDFARDPMSAGQIIDINGAKIHILAVNDLGMATRIKVRPDSAYADARLVYWQDGQFHTLELEAGETWYF